MINLAHNSAITAEFPFLKGLMSMQSSKSGCSRCGGGAKKKANQAILNNAKTALASTSDDKKRKLKALLKSAQVRLYYQAGAKIVKLTF
jgi:hypothetical protein